MYNFIRLFYFYIIFQFIIFRCKFISYIVIEICNSLCCKLCYCRFQTNNSIPIFHPGRNESDRNRNTYSASTRVPLHDCCYLSPLIPLRTKEEDARLYCLETGMTQRFQHLFRLQTFFKWRSLKKYLNVLHTWCCAEMFRRLKVSSSAVLIDVVIRISNIFFNAIKFSERLFSIKNFKKHT